MSIQKIVKSWSMPDRTKERTQITLRVNYDDYARLHALKEVYPKRSVNDMINDILHVGLDDVVDSLESHPITQFEAEEMACEEPNSNGCDYTGIVLGPAVDFERAYVKLMSLQDIESDNESELEVITR